MDLNIADSKKLTCLYITMSKSRAVTERKDFSKLTAVLKDDFSSSALGPSMPLDTDPKRGGRTNALHPSRHSGNDVAGVQFETSTHVRGQTHLPKPAFASSKSG